jgi:hypothetical protein
MNGIRFPEGAEGFLYVTASRPTLGPTQPHIQRLPGVKRPRRETDRSPQPSARVNDTSTWRYA